MSGRKLLDSTAYVVWSKSFPPDQLFKVTEIKQICYFSTLSPFTSTHFSTNTLTSPWHYISFTAFSIWRGLLYVRPETFGPYYVYTAYLLILYSVYWFSCWPYIDQILPVSRTKYEVEWTRSKRPKTALQFRQHSKLHVRDSNPGFLNMN